MPAGLTRENEQQIDIRKKLWNSHFLSYCVARCKERGEDDFKIYADRKSVRK